ncbi:MAG: HlyD family efflux transporter periplasmic adaptor subunit [Pseudomonadales bacterium]|nr:HlyD family efflux transporter periplasmic adaptor subunit [Pseudomonadales bacterium]
MSVSSLFSPHWYRVAELKPRLKGHIDIHRHVYRDQIWYVLQNHITGKFHRFTPAAYQVLDQLNGEKSVDEIWQSAVAGLGAEAPSQDDLINLLGQLHAAGALASDVPPDIAEMTSRLAQEKRQKWRQKILSPLAIKVPLIDPDRILTPLAPWFRPVFSTAGIFIWLCLVVMALVTAGIHWSVLTENISAEVLSPGNLLLLAVLFPLIKALHELGHALAVKAWGGEVHEMGIMLLVFMPVPYVDASAASAFREPFKRLIVGAAGMMVEVLIAVIALFYWLDAPEGVGKSIAYNVMLIAGVSTLLFNANPLLRFDGYYMLVDGIQIPNLFVRANRYFTYGLQKYILGMKRVVSPVRAPGERRWFIFYSISSFVYRAFLSVAIALFIAKEFFIVGVALALWTLSAMFVLPLLKGLRFMIIRKPAQGNGRVRPWVAVISVVSIGFVMLCLVPVPRWTNAQGVVWLPDSAIVRVGTDCQISEVTQAPDSMVTQGLPLIQCDDPFLSKDIDVLQARRREQEVAYYQAIQESPVDAALKQKNLDATLADLQRAQERMADLTIISPATGRFVVPLVQDLPGKYVRKGDEIGYVLPDQPTRVRAVVPQQDIGVVRDDLQRIELRFAHDVGSVFEGVIDRAVPGGSNRLPSAVLGTLGGGDIGIDPRQGDQISAFEKWFEFDITLTESVVPRHYEQRVYLRFYHSSQPVLWQWLHDLRLLLLEEFSV